MSKRQNTIFRDFIFRHLELEIALAIPASSDEKYNLDLEEEHKNQGQI